MADFNQHNQFGSVRPAQSTDARNCARFEAMLADAVDGTLSAEDQAAFDAHLLTCATCNASLADARRGLAWLEMLRTGQPEPASDLLQRIFAQTTGQTAVQIATHVGASAVGVQPAAAIGSDSLTAQPLGKLHLAPESTASLARSTAHAGTIGPLGINVIPFPQRLAARLTPLRQTLLQPRLAMTAAMAFFSVAVTLNLTGVRLTQLRASDLRPSNVKRSFYEANAHVVRYYDNLRVVYELESRVHELQRPSEASDRSETPAGQSTEAPARVDPQPIPDTQPGAAPVRPVQPRPKPGTSLREPLFHDRRYSASFRSSTSRRDLQDPAPLTLDEPRPTQERILA